MTRLPTGVDPVKDTIDTDGWLTSASPASGPAPTTTLTTPAGRPAAMQSSASMSEVSGVISAGLSTMVLPAAIAGQDLPHRHLQRVVPGGDRPDDADRLAPDQRRVDAVPLGRGLALEVARRPGEERDVVDRPRARRTRSSVGSACRTAASRRGRTPRRAPRAGRPAASAPRTARPEWRRAHSGNAAAAAARRRRRRRPRPAAKESTTLPSAGLTTSPIVPEEPARACPPAKTASVTDTSSPDPSAPPLLRRLRIQPRKPRPDKGL